MHAFLERRATVLAAVLSLLPLAAVAQEAPGIGPDRWIVSGLAAGSRLNLRSDPAPSARIVARLANNDTLGNRGCREVEGERWCRLERRDGTAGWAVARFLREATTRTPVAPEPEPIFDATGTIPCAMIPGQPTRDCSFGVTRRAPGSASIRVTGTGGGMRWIYFDEGVPVRADGAGVFVVERMADLFLIRVGSERYEVPLAVATGG